MLDLGITNAVKDDPIEDMITADELYASFLESDQVIMNVFNAFEIVEKAARSHSNECIQFANDLLGVSCEAVVNNSGTMMKQMDISIDTTINQLARMIKVLEGLMTRWKKCEARLDKYKRSGSLDKRNIAYLESLEDVTVPKYIEEFSSKSSNAGDSDGAIKWLKGTQQELNTMVENGATKKQPVYIEHALKGFCFIAKAAHSSLTRMRGHLNSKQDPDLAKDVRVQMRANFMKNNEFKSDYKAVRTAIARFLKDWRECSREIITKFNRLMKVGRIDIGNLDV